LRKKLVFPPASMGFGYDGDDVLARRDRQRPLQRCLQQRSTAVQRAVLHRGQGAAGIGSQSAQALSIASRHNDYPDTTAIRAHSKLPSKIPIKPESDMGGRGYTPYVKADIRSFRYIHYRRTGNFL
jgi:hypothetical protein